MAEGKAGKKEMQKAAMTAVTMAGGKADKTDDRWVDPKADYLAEPSVATMAGGKVEHLVGMWAESKAVMTAVMRVVEMAELWVAWWAVS